MTATPSVQRFAHEAMATEFTAAIALDSEERAREAAEEAFSVVDRIERLFSRFLPGSDVARINKLRDGESLRVNPETLECLSIAFELSALTGGAFDATVGQLMDAAPADIDGLQRARSAARLVLQASPPVVHCEKAGLAIDLGGIGKGYALDAAAMALREWGVARALLGAGGSTVLGLDPAPGREGWAVTVGGDAGRQQLQLRNQALSCSGTAVKGGHILDPATGQPAAQHVRSWVLAPSAAHSDALSTGFFVMPEEAIRAVLPRCPGTGAWLEERAEGGRTLLVRVELH
jgi:FAD:protein FMN transferase